MASGILFYDTIVPLNRDRHRDVMLDVGPDRFAFARGSHVIPAVVDELVAAAAHLPIVFVPGPTVPTLVFLVGLRANQNVLIDDHGVWHGEYVPAFVRRYPFMFGEMEGRDPITCIDQAYADAPRVKGERLFLEDGAETPILQERIRLINEYFVAARRNDEFSKLVNELQLLRSVTIDAKFQSGEAASIHGFMTIDTAKLEALPDEAYLRLRKERFLPAIYAHLSSLAGVDNLRRRIDERKAVNGAGATE